MSGRPQWRRGRGAPRRADTGTRARDRTSGFAPGSCATYVCATRRGAGAGPGRLMSTQPLDIVILGLSITSSWGNGHATTYRSLVRHLVGLGHRVLFLERD